MIAVYTLEQRWEVLRRYFENHGNVAECVGKLRTDFAAPSAPYIRYIVKKGKKLPSSSVNQSVQSQK